MPISSLDPTSILWEKSPEATRLAPSVRRSMGVIMVLASRKESSTELTKPKIRAWMMSMKRELLSSCTVWRLS